MPSFKIVELDITSICTIPEDERGQVLKILDVFVYDDGEQTHCCEATPSFYLFPVLTRIETPDDLDEDTRDSLQDKYCYEATDPCYMHCSDVEALKPEPAEKYINLKEIEENEDGGLTLENVTAALSSVY
jgi:hypothetical protein